MECLKRLLVTRGFIEITARTKAVETELSTSFYIYSIFLNVCMYMYIVEETCATDEGQRERHERIYLVRIPYLYSIPYTITAKLQSMDIFPQARSISTLTNPRTNKNRPFRMK